MTRNKLIRELNNRIRAIRASKLPIEATITHTSLNEALDSHCGYLKDIVSYLTSRPTATLMELNKILRHNYPAVFKMAFDTSCSNKSLKDLALENGNSISSIVGLQDTDILYYDGAIHNINTLTIK